MHLDSENKFIRTDIWREGKWIDLWSIIHFFSGATIGFLPKYFGLEKFSAYAIIFLLLVLYEMFEALAKIKETPQNRVMDVVVGMASSMIVYHFHPFISGSTSVFMFGAFLIFAGALSVIGWHASQKAAEFEEKLRVEISISRQRIKNRLRERRESRNFKKMKKRELRNMKDLEKS